MTKQAVQRVSARTTKMEFSQKYGTKYCIPEWLRDEQIRIAIRKVKGRIQTSEEKRAEPIAVVGFGPSLKETWEQVRGFKYVMSCSGAHKFLIERGIVPTWHVEVDPRDHKIDLLGPAHKDVTYLPSSTSHPRYLDHLLASGADVQLWHVFTTEAEGNRILPPGEWALTGGADAGLRALVMARLFGFVDIHVFGIDGSAGPATESHADKHPNTPGKFFDCEFPEGSGRIYKTTPALLSCAKSVPHEVRQIKDAAFTFHGEGLVQAIMREQKIEPTTKETQIAFIKPDLISDGYRDLNAKLHEDNPLYGTSGSKYVETVLRLAKQLGTSSILDYGCGKGMLAKGIPFPIWEYDPAVSGKDEAPRPADIVVCTDVLEHVEPENLGAVLADLARCTAKVGFFVIHTGPAQKTLADGRNAHLIQQPAKWWEKKLGKFFDVAKTLAVGPSVHVVVGPKSGDANVTKVQHDGTVAKFYTPNDTTKWRAQTLFTKEPSTIAWIDTFKPGEVLWDVGANVGGYTVWASRRRGVKVFAFEPDAQNYALLCRNMALNQVDGLAYCLALGNPDEAGVGTLYLSGMDAGGSCNTFGESLGPDLKPRDGIKQGAVCMAGDALELPKPDHIKIDVDGLEHRVVAGAWGTILGAKSVLVEVNLALPEHQRLVAAMQKAGFVFDPAQVESATRKDGPFKGCAEYVFRRLGAENDDAAFTMRRIAGAKLRMEPFPHLYVEDVFLWDFYNRLRGSLPVGGWKSLAEARGTEGYPERSVNEAPACVDWMRSGDLRRLLDEKFGVKSASDELLLLRDKPGYKIPPHTDTPRKVVTMLIYLPTDESMKQHGTSIYRPKASGFTCPEGRHHRFEDFDKVWTAPFKPNSALIFARTDDSFHGVEAFDGDGVRDILLWDSRK